MLYLANASSPRVREAMTTGLLGQMVTPAEGKRPLIGVPYGGDNGLYGTGYPGDDRWWAWVQSLPRENCLFIVAPDVIADAKATLIRSRPWLPRIRALGFPAALVAQDGLENLDVPWDEFDVLFIGGSTEWKLSQHTARLVREAKEHGKPVHMGRVNSRRRWRYAEVLGCDSSDGTFIARWPDTNLLRQQRWQDHNLFGEAPWTA